MYRTAKMKPLIIATLFHSDHLTALDSFLQREPLVLSSSLAAVALCVERLRIKPLVCSPARLLAFCIAGLAGIDSGGARQRSGSVTHKRLVPLKFRNDFWPSNSPVYHSARDAREVCTGVPCVVVRPAVFDRLQYQLAETEIRPAAILPLITSGKNQQRTVHIAPAHAIDEDCTCM